MSEKFAKTKPSFLEGGLPCSSLSAECQRDNNARERPPQNRLHIWWARRAPTICRAAILSSLLPHDLDLDDSVLPSMVEEPSKKDIPNLPRKFEPYAEFFVRLLREVRSTPLTHAHREFLRAMGITGDADAAYRRIAYALENTVDGHSSQMPAEWGYRHPPAFRVSPSEILIDSLLDRIRQLCCVRDGDPVVLLDSMAGGGSIPLEGVRYGVKVFANDLNPVAALVLKATIHYPAWFGRQLTPQIAAYSQELARSVHERMRDFFYHQSDVEWWPECRSAATAKFSAKSIKKREPAGEERIQATLWCKTIPCPKCGLTIPLSTNWFISKPKGKPDEEIAAFPEIPTRGNECSFRIVSRPEWDKCLWPKPDFTRWHPNGDIPPNGKTPRCDGYTYKDGNAYCPRCGKDIPGDEVKAYARSRSDEGGLAAQMYGVCSQVPVKLTYRDGDVKVRSLWRFRVPISADLQAVRSAERELTRLRAKWTASDLIPTEEIPEGEKTREPRNMGMFHWRDFFSPRQLLSDGVVLEEIIKLQERMRKELPAEQGEAVSVYLTMMLSKIINYNSASSSWHDSRRQIRGMMMGHDLRYHAGFTEMEANRETIAWAATQVVSAYDALAGLIHGEDVCLEGGEDDDISTGENEVEPDSGEDAEEDESMNGEPLIDDGMPRLRPEVIVPTVTCDDAAALSEPGPGTVHLICVDPPYYNNVQYSELSNFFYVWLKRALRDFDGLSPLFREPLAESNREAVANPARWKREEEEEQARWQDRYEKALQRLRGQGAKLKQAKAAAEEAAGTKPQTAAQRADRFYEDKMSAVFRRARQLLHPAGRMVVMFNHKQTAAWSSLGMALTRAGFEVRSSVPIHTEAESSLNIRGLDAARSTVLLMCVPREEREQPEGNWSTVQKRVNHVARAAAQRFQGQGLSGTDLYLSALGPALGEVGKNWPVTTLAGREVDLEDALEEAYKAVGAWRLEQILASLTERAKADELLRDFTAESVDRNTQTLWLWLDTFQGEVAGTDDVRRLAKSLNVEPDAFKRLGLLKVEKDTFVLQSPTSLDLRRLARQLRGEETGRGRAARAADAWEERVFPEFLGAAVWNAVGLMLGAEEGARGPESLKRWLRESGYGSERDFRGAFLVTLHLLEAAFRNRREDDEWLAATTQARRAWDLVMQNGRR